MDKAALKDVRIGDSRFTRSLALVLSALLTAVTAWLFFGGWRVDLASFGKQLAGTFAVPRAAVEDVVALALVGLCSLVTLVLFARLLRRQQPRLLVVADGIWDPRVAPQMLAWHAVQSVADGVLRGERVVLLNMHAAILATLSLPNELAENRKLGLKGVPISARGLAISHWRLRRLIRRYHVAATSHMTGKSP